MRAAACRSSRQARRRFGARAWLLGDVEEGCDEREGKDPGGDASGDQSGAHVPACGLAIHWADFYQARGSRRLGRDGCPLPETVAQLSRLQTAERLSLSLWER